MPLVESRAAIGAVGEFLRSRLTTQTSAGSVAIGRPETAAVSGGPKFNLFLYHIEIDSYLRNRALDAGQQAPLWLVLHYLLTAFDTDTDSDSVAAHELLGEGMLALQQLSFGQPASPALQDNPEILKVTFESADVELLSRIMQGTDERYRISSAFQVRPVMIAPSDPPRYAPLVTSVGPPHDEGVFVTPGLGPTLIKVEPLQFESGAELTITGTELSSAVQDIRIGNQTYGISAASAGRVMVQVQATTLLSPGSHALAARSLSAAGRWVTSNALIATLMPSLASVSAGPLTPVAPGNLHGTLTLTGSHLGGPDDQAFVAFYRDGEVRLMLEANGNADQTSLVATVTIDQALPGGFYFIILRVNGAQAALMPQVDWS